MLKRKSWLICLLLCSFLLLATGCNQAELNYLSLQQEMGSLEVTESNGDFFISLKGIPGFSLEENIKLFSKTDLNNETAILNIYWGESEELLTEIIMQKDTIYLYLPELLKALPAWGYSEEAQKLEAIFGETEYLSLTMEEYYNALGLDNTELATMGLMTQNNFFNQKQTDFLQKILTTLPEIYADFSTNLITAEDNAFTLKLDGYQAINVFFNFLEYNLLNCEVIIQGLVDLLDNLSDEEFALLNLDPSQKAIYALLLSFGIEELQTNQDDYLEGLTELKNELLNEPDLQPYLDKISLSSTLAQDPLGTYHSLADFTFKLPDFDFTLKGQAQTKEIAPFAITTPNKTMTTSEYLNRIKREMVIDVDQATYTLNDAAGSLTIHNHEDHLYLPLRQIGELLNEEVGWDSELSQAYVARHNIPINMTGIILEDRNYIKIRDFNKLGYQVDWNEETRTVTLISTRL